MFLISKKGLRKTFIVFCFVLGGFIIFSLIGFYNTKKHFISILNYGSYTVGRYYKKDTRAKGATLARYRYEIDGKTYENITTETTFSNSKPLVGHYYFVVFNYYKPEESTLFFYLEVPDSLENLYGKKFKKIPIESFQQKVDSIIIDNLDGVIERYIPPYIEDDKLLKL